MSDLEDVRKKRMKELMLEQQLQQQQSQFQQQLSQEQEIEAQIKHIVTQILTPEARERLANIRVARPSYARQIEILLIQLAQAGKLPGKITDQQLKEILGRFSQKRRETTIERK
ncbi:DNA-binding protein [Candidatus Altiarchaeota archaeon]